MTTESDKLARSFGSIPSIPLDTPAQMLSKIQGLFPIVQNFLETKDSLPFHRTEPFKNIDKVFARSVPQVGSSWDDIVKFFTQEVVPRFSSNANNKFLAYVPGDPSPAALAGAMIMPAFNQYVGSTLSSNGGVAIESLTLQWFKELMGYSLSAGACYTSGGSLANLTCLYAGLTDKIPWLKEKGLSRNKIPLVYCSDQTHNSLIKALLMFGLGLENIRIIPTEDDFKINLTALRETIVKDRQDDQCLPVIVIANAGTTNTGAIDDIDALLEISSEFNLWLHIDGAYGALSRITETKASSLLQNMHKADSIALDAHKWMFIPYEAGISLVKEREKLKKAFSISADYLSESHAVQETQLMVNFWEYSPQLSREFRGLKIWFFLMSYGLEGLKTFITRNILLAKYLTAKIQEDTNFELMSSSELSIVCFRWKGSDELNDAIITKIQENSNYYISKTTLKGKTTIRVCIVNLSSDVAIIDGLLKEIKEVVEGLQK